MARNLVTGYLTPVRVVTGPAHTQLRGVRSLTLLLGNGEGLLHFDLAAVCDDHILQGLVPAVGLGALHLPHHVLGKKAGGGVEVKRHTAGTWDSPREWLRRVETHMGRTQKPREPRAQELMARVNVEHRCLADSIPLRCE